MTAECSVIVVTWNSQEIVLQCVQSILKFSSQIVFEIIIVDNGSVDTGYLSFISSMEKVRIIKNESNLGFAKAVNIGYRHAGGQYILVLNPDIIFVADTVTPCIRILKQEKDVGVAAPLLYGRDGMPQIFHFYPKFPTILQYVCLRSALHYFGVMKSVAQKFFHSNIVRNNVNYVDQVPGAYLLFPKNLFHGNPLDERYYMWMEDVDFCKRMNKMGKKVAVVGHLKTIHIGGTSFDMWSHDKKLVQFVKSYMMYIAIHHSYLSYVVHWAVVWNDVTWSTLFALGRTVMRGDTSAFIYKLKLRGPLIAFLIVHFFDRNFSSKTK